MQDSKLSQAINSLSENISRREFLNAGVGLGVTLSGIRIVSGCATTETHKDHVTLAMGNLDYKIYPPNNGCLVGFYKPDVPSTSLDHYKNSIGAKPFLFALVEPLSKGFPFIEAITIKKYGVMPYINIYPGRSIEKGRKVFFSPDDIVKGRSDWYIKRLAKDAVKFGEKYGNFFFTTMFEPNVEWWPWSRKPDTTPAVRHFWQIFEDHGVNQYATWTWEAFCPKRYGRLAEDPEPYYPGDKYVDWIGMNVFANLKNQKERSMSENTMLSELLLPTYEQMINNHPQKYMMVSEFGRTPGDNQKSWLIDAYRSIKNEFQRIKAAIYYDNITNVHGGQDHTLDRESLNTLKEVYKDPYWIMAK